jgi:hypothetical protein
MDEVTIQKIAAEVARHLPSYAWVLLLVQVVILAAAAAVGAFFGEYLKTRGKNLATKADFESLKNQLRANTELVETIKAEVGQKDWARREWTNLRRTKLEALTTALHECEAYIERYRSKSVRGESVNERDPEKELSTVVTLYLPELWLEAAQFSSAYHNEISAGLEMSSAVMQAGSDQVAIQKAYEQYKAKWRPEKISEASTALKNSARKLLVKFMGVDERQ